MELLHEMAGRWGARVNAGDSSFFKSRKNVLKASETPGDCK